MKKIIKKGNDAIQRALLFKNKKEEISMLADIVNSDFLDAIKLSLQVRGVNPAKLASDLGVSKSYISQIFNSNRMLNITFIAKIRRQYSIPLELVDTSRYITSITIVNRNDNTIAEFNKHAASFQVPTNTIDIQFEEVSITTDKKEK